MLPLLAMPASKRVGPTLKTHRNPIHSEKPRATAGKPNPRPLRAPAPIQLSSTATLGTTPTPEQDRRHQENNCTQFALSATTAAAPRNRRQQRRARTGAAPPPLWQQRVCPTTNIKVSVLQALQQCSFVHTRSLRKLKAVHVKVCRMQRSSGGFQGSSFKFKQILAGGQRA